MCGIVAYVGDMSAAPMLVHALERLSYRGYDSAGIAIANKLGILVEKDVGEIEEIERNRGLSKIPGNIGIGHTRWATAGGVTRYNAHPHTSCDGDVAIVHNGEIENYEELREQLEKEGHRFQSECDSEVLAHLLEGKDWHEGHKEISRRAKGYWAIAAADSERKNVFVARKEQPLYLGISKHGTFVASDIPALLPYTKDFIRLRDGEYAII